MPFGFRRRITAIGQRSRTSNSWLSHAITLPAGLELDVGFNYPVYIVQACATSPFTAGGFAHARLQEPHYIQGQVRVRASTIETVRGELRG